MKSQDPSSVPVVQDTKAVAPEGVEAIGSIFRGMVEPLAASQVDVARETTRQTEIIANSTSKFFNGVFAIAGMIVVLAGAALFLGKDQITEKIIIALLAFLGGFGVGKSMKR